MKFRKIIHTLTTPFRVVRKAYYDWLNSSSMMSADWLRRQRINRFIENSRRGQ